VLYRCIVSVSVHEDILTNVLHTISIVVLMFWLLIELYKVGNVVVVVVVVIVVVVVVVIVVVVIVVVVVVVVVVIT
jgi:hypothetical protein